MSFGFSVGDIILLSQLAYNLYGTVTSGRRNASRDLKELEDVLFGLRCALDHLRHVANDIATATATSERGSTAIEMRRKLDQMVQNCATTLEELDARTKKYRDGANQGEAEDGEVDVSQAGIRLKRRLASNFIKVRWDMDKQALKEYRDKLQSHTDAINVVLNTFLWSTTHKIQTDGKANTEKMHKLQNRAMQSNASLLQLVQDIHSVVLESKNSPLFTPSTQSPSEALPRPLASNPGYANVSFVDTVSREGPQAMKIRSIDAYYGTARMNPKASKNNLPSAIVSLNVRRQSIGAKKFTEYKQKDAPISRPSFLTADVPTVPQLHHGLVYIFRSFPRSTPRQMDMAWETRKSEMSRWTRTLDHLLYSPGPTSSLNQELEGLQQSDLIDLLVHLNEEIEKADVQMRGLFYQASATAQIDQVLDNLLRVSKSVRAMKEAEEFADERENWRQSMGGNE